MKTTKLFRSVVMGALILALMTSMIACSPSAAPTAAPTTAAATGAAPGQTAGAAEHLPLCKPGDVTLDFLTYQNWDAAAYYDSADGLPIENEIEKITGVKIKWECVSSDDYNTVAATRLAAGSNLPDILRVPEGTVGLAKYSAEGLLINMSQYMSEQDTPYVTKLFADEPIYKAYSTSPDGNIYGFPYTEYDINNYVVMWSSIRQDWLDKLNLKMPTTVDEYHDVLLHFLNDDPNGNGKKDEIPQCYLNDAMFGLYRFKEAFGFSSTDMWSVDKDGKVHLDLVEPNFKDCLTTLNQWYKEGLLYTQVDGKGWEEICSQNRMGAQSIASMDNLLTYNGFCKAVEPNCNYVYIPLLTNKNYPDNQPKLNKRYSWHDYFSVTKECKNPKIAVQWLDWVWASEDSSTLRYWGFENQTFKIADGKKAFLDNVTKTDKGAIGEMRTLGGWPNFVGHESGECFMAMYAGQYPEVANKEFSPLFVDNVPDAIGTTEENESYTTLWPDLQTYIKEMVVNFITGTKDLSEWDNYVATCNSMGLDKVIAVKQAWNERMTGSK